MNQPSEVDQSSIPFLYQERPLHTPGSIQPHGVLLVLAEPELQIVQVSSNTEVLWGAAAADLLGQSLQSILAASSVEAIQEAIARTSPSPRRFSLTTVIDQKNWDATLHRIEAGWMLELELVGSSDPLSFVAFHDWVSGAIARMQSATTVTELLTIAVQDVQQITGFERVHVYRFDHQGAGEVIAEARSEELPSYLGLHFPEGDIPAPVRSLYQRKMMRFVPNLYAPPAPLVPLDCPLTGQPLDLSATMIRSVDPCCVEFHRNMGSAAILVLPLLKEQTLWGLISCHHSRDWYVSGEVRLAVQFLAQVMTQELNNKVQQQELDYRIRLKSLQSEFIESIAQSHHSLEALTQTHPSLLSVVNAQGAAVCLGEEISQIGTTPDLETIRTLVAWADERVNNSLFYTDCLPTLYPAAIACKETASGLLLLRISRAQHYYILWFRPEVLQTVTWAGNPQEATQPQSDGTLLLSPRSSFQQWQETVRYTALSWQECEIESALDLRNAIVGMVLKQAEELARINRELEQSNRELDSFAFAASHDLKEPLRAIHNYSTILLEDYAGDLDQEGMEYLDSLVSLTQRMERLIDVLLQFSRLGQTELHLQETNLNEVLERAIAVFYASRDSVLPIRVPRSLPTVCCDPVLISEVFSNLIGNALKYNDKPAPWVEVGFIDLTPCTFYVRDNGIGIRQHHQDLIFRLFKRLHSQEEYGGGTGAGLTIARKIVERHGGHLWVESTYGEGSTFYFTLA